MWKKIRENNDLNEIIINTILLKYPNDIEQPTAIPIGNESNSDKYKVVNRNFDGVEVEFIFTTTLIGNYSITSIKRQVSNKQLIDGTWWVEK